MKTTRRDFFKKGVVLGMGIILGKHTLISKATEESHGRLNILYNTENPYLMVGDHNLLHHPQGTEGYQIIDFEYPALFTPSGKTTKIVSLNKPSSVLMLNNLSK